MPTAANLSVADIQAQAQAERGDEVKKELVKKYKVITKRQGQLAAHVASFDAKVKAFEDQVAAASNPEQIMAALSNHKFPASVINLNVRQDD